MVPFTWHVIIKKGCLLHSSGPVLQIKLCRPVKQLVQHHRPCQVGDSLDGTFSHTILVEGTNTTELEVNGLVLISEVGLELCRVKGEIVRVELLEADARAASLLLELPQRPDSVPGTKCLLIP